MYTRWYSYSGCGKNQYDVPIGTLAFWKKKEDMELYLRSEDSKSASFNDPMLVFAGFTDRSLTSFKYDACEDSKN